MDFNYYSTDFKNLHQLAVWYMIDLHCTIKHFKLQIGVRDRTDLCIDGFVWCKGKEESLRKLLLRYKFRCSEAHDGHSHSISSETCLFLFDLSLQLENHRIRNPQDSFQNLKFHLVQLFVVGRQYVESFLYIQYNVPINRFIPRCKIGEGAARRHQRVHRTLHQRRQGKRIDPLISLIV